MDRKILRLPEAAINQIAAGEVVENPASIVKELIENSLDAGAQRIEIEIIGGGQQLIRVEDDGVGMGPEDALLCVERHATSKIRSFEDLQLLGTMGFRGEALAAIAAVSQFELKTSEGQEGTCVQWVGGTPSSVSPCARNRGTTIEVRSLFYNVPARKKFQKSASANTAQVTRTVEILALAHPEISFTLIVQEKKVLELSPSSPKERIEEILGSHELEVLSERDGLRLWGLLASPSKAAPTRTGQHLYINFRPIFSPLISRAVKNGFGTRIGENAHPGFVLFLEISPEEVDVNVHPQKKEARFREESRIYQLFEGAISGAFGAPSFSEPLSFSPPPSFHFEERPFPTLAFPPAEEPLPFSYPERPLRVLGNYLLLERETVLLIDLKAAWARVLFESLKFDKGTSQALIWPLEIALTREEAVEGEKMAAELIQIGVECRFLGQKTIAIDALPPFLDEAHFPTFFAKWREEKQLAPVATSFCRSFKRNYSLDEAISLWRRLQDCKDSLFDPLGNRIWISIQETDFERMIKTHG